MDEAFKELLESARHYLRSLDDPDVPRTGRNGGDPLGELRLAVASADRAVWEAAPEHLPPSQHLDRPPRRELVTADYAPGGDGEDAEPFDGLS